MNVFNRPNYLFHSKRAHSELAYCMSWTYSMVFKYNTKNELYISRFCTEIDIRPSFTFIYRRIFDITIPQICVKASPGTRVTDPGSDWPDPAPTASNVYLCKKQNMEYI